MSTPEGMLVPPSPTPGDHDRPPLRFVDLAAADPEIVDSGLALAEEVFALAESSDQLQATPENLERLAALAPATVLYALDPGAEGPQSLVAWCVSIPTQPVLACDFAEGVLLETDLLWATTPEPRYRAWYVCAVAVRPEWRRRHVARELVYEAARRLPLEPRPLVVVWPTSPEGQHPLASLEGIAGPRPVSRDLRRSLRPGRSWGT